uniref:Uncharacterized protein n=1 Tax=Arundo donax TaxID=35708 RepID=A0A0A9BNG7_ARUDO
MGSSMPKILFPFSAASIYYAIRHLMLWLIACT